MLWIGVCVYGLFVLVALLNLGLMPRPRRAGTEPVPILIPARNEADNLARLVPELVAQGARVYVFDDESTDDTAAIAAKCGAQVIRGGPLPESWLGKNRACHELAKVVAEAEPAEWFCFLDADTDPKPGFVAALSGLVQNQGRRHPVITGFPHMLPGRFPEPTYLGWVPWVLLATNPFGLVARSRLGHNGFTNGQIVLWRASTYWELTPNQALRDRVLEDVAIGRLLAREKRPVAVCALASILAVRMYADVSAAIEGMSKNSSEIAGNALGTYALALVLLAIAWLWAAMGPWWWLGLGLLVLGKVLTDRIVRFAWWTPPFMPLTLTLAAWTLVRSQRLKAAGKLSWKGRRVG